MSIFLLFALPAAALAGLVAVSGFLLLEPCALGMSLFDRYGDCRPAAEVAAERRLAELDLARVGIERELYDLERELAGIQCVATGPDQERPLVAQGWRNEVLPMLYGCWDVSLDYQTRDVDDDSVASYTDWQICFDTLGGGHEIMRDAGGVICEGPVSARYSGAGLTLSEPENLACDDGGYIHRREMSCQLAEDGSALCATLQPETGGAADVSVARRYSQ